VCSRLLATVVAVAALLSPPLPGPPTADAASREHPAANVSGQAPVPRAATPCFGHSPTIPGTSGDDVGSNALRGTPGQDVIAGLSGNDEIYGLSGNDLICGGGGSDIIYGGGGADRISGGPGNDRIYGGEANDSISSGGGKDYACGQGGDDDLTVVDLRPGDTVNGGPAHDSCTADVGDHLVDCEAKHIRRS